MVEDSSCSRDDRGTLVAAMGVEIEYGFAPALAVPTQAPPVVPPPVIAPPPHEASPVLSEGPFREALDVARTGSFSPAEWEAYDRAKMAEQDAPGAFALARDEGVVQGKRAAPLRLVARARLALGEDDRARIQPCADAARLDRWLDQMLGGKTAAEVLS